MISRIGIIGDVHARHEELASALHCLQDAGVDLCLCTGDLVDGVGDVDACVELLQAFNVRVVRGNHDRWLLQNKARHVADAHFAADLSQTSYDYLAGLPIELRFETSAGPLLLCHGVGQNDLAKVWPGSERMPPERSTRLDELIADGEIRWLINGHMHYRTIIHFQQLTLINAGTLKPTHRPGFSLLDLNSRDLTGYEFHPQPQAVCAVNLSDEPPRVFHNSQEFDGQWQPLVLYP
ncbi:MAG: metallophosphoesterase family protein [Pseudomonadota bacterium]